MQEDWQYTAHSVLSAKDGLNLVMPGVNQEEDICGVVCEESSGSCWKDSSSTFPFLSNFEGLTRAVPDLIQTLSDLAEL